MPEKHCALCGSVAAISPHNVFAAMCSHTLYLRYPPHPQDLLARAQMLAQLLLQEQQQEEEVEEGQQEQAQELEAGVRSQQQAEEPRQRQDYDMTPPRVAAAGTMPSPQRSDTSPATPLPPAATVAFGAASPRGSPGADGGGHDGYATPTPNMFTFPEE